MVKVVIAPCGPTELNVCTNITGFINVYEPSKRPKIPLEYIVRVYLICMKSFIYFARRIVLWIRQVLELSLSKWKLENKWGLELVRPAHVERQAPSVAKFGKAMWFSRLWLTISPSSRVSFIIWSLSPVKVKTSKVQTAWNFHFADCRNLLS